MELPEDQASQIQVWSLPDYLNVHGTKMPDGAYGANLDEAWRQFYASHPDSFYLQGKGLLTEEFKRTLKPDLSVKMAQKAIDVIQGGGVHPKIENGPMIYVARYGGSHENSRELDAMCQVSINKRFDPGPFEPSGYRGEGFFRKLRTRVAGLIKPKTEPNRTTALTIRFYADAQYLGGVYSQEKGYEDVRGRVLEAMVKAALRGCQEPPKYVETYIVPRDKTALERFKRLGLLTQGGTSREEVFDELGIARVLVHYSVKSPKLL